MMDMSLSMRVYTNDTNEKRRITSLQCEVDRQRSNSEYESINSIAHNKDIANKRLDLSNDRSISNYKKVHTLTQVDHYL